MNFSTVKHYLGYGLAIILLLLLGRFYLDEKIGRIKAEAEQRIVEERDRAQKVASEEFDRRIAALKTPEQAGPAIQQALQRAVEGKNAIKSPISVPKEKLTPEVQALLPDAPAVKSDAPVMLLTPDQQVALGRRELGCQKTEGELSTCELDKRNLQSEINDLKGGSKWQRVGKEAKCLGFLGLGAGLGAKLGGWKGAVLGGIGGEVGCRIFF